MRRAQQMIDRARIVIEKASRSCVARGVVEEAVVTHECGRGEKDSDECDRRDDTQLLVDTASRESRDGVEGGEWRRNRVEAEEWGAES